MAVQDIPTTLPAAPGADRCPFARPFPEDFSDCAAYQQASFTAADSNHRALGTHLTCRHLAVGTNPPERGGFYARCALGSRAERLRWVAAVRPERLEALQHISDELEALRGSRRQELFELKAQLLRSPADNAAREALAKAVETYIAELGIFIDTHAAQVEAVGLPGPALARLLDEWLRRWAGTRDMAAVEPRAELLAAFDGPIRELLRGGGWRVDKEAQASEAAPGARRESGEGWSPLLISPGAEPHQVRLVGDVDEATTAAFAAALAEVVRAQGKVEVDMRGVVSCDAGAMRVLVAAAETVPDDGYIAVVGLAPHLQKVMDLSAWGDLPRLRLHSGDS